MVNQDFTMEKDGFIVLVQVAWASQVSVTDKTAGYIPLLAASGDDDSNNFMIPVQKNHTYNIKAYCVGILYYALT